MAFITEQAGGSAIGMGNRILEIAPEILHQRTAFFCGSKRLIDEIETYVDEYSN